MKNSPSGRWSLNECGRKGGLTAFIINVIRILMVEIHKNTKFNARVLHFEKIQFF